MLSLTADFLFISAGRLKRAIDLSPIRRDQWLVERVNALSEENRLYAGQHDRDRRTLAELKKILEIGDCSTSTAIFLMTTMHSTATVIPKQLQRSELASSET